MTISVFPTFLISRSRLLRLALIVSTAAVTGLQAQAPVPTGATVYASGLRGPRGLTFGPDGLLYVSEAGTGGTLSTIGVCPQVVPPVGPYTGGTTARVVSIASNGTVTAVASGFPSAVDAMGDVLGVAAVTFMGTDLYALVAGGGCSHGNLMPNGVYLVNPTDHSAKLVADLSAFVQAHPVRHPNAGDFEPDDVPYSMIAYQNKFYVVEPNHGQLLEVSTDGVVKQVIDISAPLGHIVPTSVVVDADQFWVGNLGLFPIVIGTEKLYKISARGCVSDYLDGFTSVVGLASNGEGSIYILEFSAADGFPAPGNGRVLRVTEGLVEIILMGLAVPTSITVGPDAALYISDLGAAPAPAGRIVRYMPPPLGQSKILSSSARPAAVSATCARPGTPDPLN
jgi:hypothetical protein